MSSPVLIAITDVYISNKIRICSIIAEPLLNTYMYDTYWANIGCMSQYVTVN